MTEAQSGTLTADGTEQDLGTPETTPATYVLLVDTSNMANGDEIILRAKAKVLSAGSYLLAYSGVYQHAQGDPVKISIPVPVVHGIRFTLEQLAGTNRNYPWSIVSA